MSKVQVRVANGDDGDAASPDSVPIGSVIMRTHAGF
jgi:hypothetical protein